MKRYRVNKAAGARGFRHDVGRSARRNLQPAPQRGGWRL